MRNNINGSDNGPLLNGCFFNLWVIDGFTFPSASRTNHNRVESSRWIIVMKVWFGFPILMTFNTWYLKLYDFNRCVHNVNPVQFYGFIIFYKKKRKTCGIFMVWAFAIIKLYFFGEQSWSLLVSLYALTSHDIPWLYFQMSSSLNI